MLDARPLSTPSGAQLRHFLWQELKPKGKLVTPFNVVSLLLMATAAVILVIRFIFGLGSVTNLSQEFPWGLWVGFNVITGVAFAGGAYVLTFLVHILHVDKYRAIVRVTVLNGFLAYVFYAGDLLLELGRPWKIVNPIIGNSFGLSSVLFLVAWHFMLYMLAELVEFSPAVAEWLGLERMRRILAGLTLGAVIFGVTLSTLHQSALGALFLMAKPRIHPLWYSELIPLLFFVSSIFAGLSMVVFEGSITERVFQHRIGDELRHSHDDIVLGLARICAGVMFVYLFLKLLEFIHGQLWHYLAGGWGSWYLLEVLGLVAIPMVLFLRGVHERRIPLIKVAALLTMVGVVLNRLNISIIAYNLDAPVHYVPTWMEVVVSAAVISAEIWVLRWVILRMPVLGRNKDQVTRPEVGEGLAAARGVAGT
jgi:Ni/Fe-hydrogenase subunit HybB-like protein